MKSRDERTAIEIVSESLALEGAGTNEELARRTGLLLVTVKRAVMHLRDRDRAVSEQVRYGPVVHRLLTEAEMLAKECERQCLLQQVWRGWGIAA